MALGDEPGHSEESTSLTVGQRLAAVLADWATYRRLQPISDELLAELRDQLEAAGRDAASFAGLAGDDPLRLSKARIRQLLDCERHMLAMLAPEQGEVSIELVFGTLLDVLTSHRVTTGRLQEQPLLVAIEIMEASYDRSYRRVLNWIGGLDTAMRAALEADLVEKRRRLLGDWPELRSEWWARVQDAALLSLADGDILVEGRCDVALGGPPTGRRAAIIETKSRQFRQEDLEDAVMYALLVALRDDLAPACVVTCCGATGGVDVIWIGEDDLRSATHRLCAVLITAGELAGGRTPTETPSGRCGWCPDSAVCPSVKEDVPVDESNAIQGDDLDPF
jgi:hypothetical protein